MSLDLQKSFEELSQNPTKKAYAFSVSVGLLLIVVILFMVPSVNSLLSLYREVAAAKKTEALLKEKVANLQKAEGNYLSVADSINLINSSLPDNPAVPALIKSLEETASKSAVRIESIQIAEALLSQSSSSAEPKTTQGLVFSLSLSGDYPNLKSFLERLGKLLRTTSVESVNFSTKSETGEKLVINIFAKTYYLGLGKPTTKKKVAQEDQPEAPKGGL